MCACVCVCVCVCVFLFFRNESWMWHMFTMDGKNTNYTQPQPHEDWMETCFNNLSLRRQINKWTNQFLWLVFKYAPLLVHGLKSQI